jgi:hypothetical protein
MIVYPLRAHSTDEWLTALNMEQYASAFAGTLPRMLRSLTDSQLKEMGVRIVGHRKRLLIGASHLNAPSSAAAMIQALFRSRRRVKLGRRAQHGVSTAGSASRSSSTGSLERIDEAAEGAIPHDRAAESVEALSLPLPCAWCCRARRPSTADA